MAESGNVESDLLTQKQLFRVVEPAGNNLYIKKLLAVQAVWLGDVDDLGALLSWSR